MPSHNTLAQGKWFKMTLPDQLGNIGSEFERALRWKNKNRPDYLQKASDRLLELTDLTLADPRWKGRRLREVARLREEVCNVLFGNPADPQSAQGLRKYFLAFGTLVRRQRNPA